MADERPRKFAKDFLEKWARAEREEGPADAALERVDEALKASPQDPALWYRRGTLLLDLERWDDALEAFRRVEGLAPPPPRLQDDLAFALGKLGRTEEAAKAQEKALAVATGAARPEPPEAPPIEAEPSLKPLAEALQNQVLEQEAVERLEELGALSEQA